MDFRKKYKNHLDEPVTCGMLIEFFESYFLPKFEQMLDERFEELRRGNTAVE